MLCTQTVPCSCMHVATDIIAQINAGDMHGFGCVVSRRVFLSQYDHHYAVDVPVNHRT